MATKKPLNERQKKFLKALVDLQMPVNAGWRTRCRLAARDAGYEENTPLSDIMEPLTEELAVLAEKMLRQASVEAVFAVVDNLNHPEEMNPAQAARAKLKFDAAKDILDRTIPKREPKSQIAPVQVSIMLPAKEGVNTKLIEYQDE